MELHLKEGVDLGPLQLNDLLGGLVEDHGRDARVVLDQHGQVMEAVLKRVERLQRVVEAVRVAKQLHFSPLGLRLQVDPSRLHQPFLEIALVPFQHHRLAQQPKTFDILYHH